MAQRARRHRHGTTSAAKTPRRREREMFLQKAVMDVFPEKLNQFMEVSEPMQRTLSQVPGVIDITLTTDIASSSRLIGLVRWESQESYEAHLGLLARAQ